MKEGIEKLADALWVPVAVIAGLFILRKLERIINELIFGYEFNVLI